MSQFHATTPKANQQGSVLIVAILLLLLGSIISILALNVGVFEQRASGNDMRAKLAQQVADAALSQGTEFVAANEDLAQTQGNWELCSNIGANFPCGAVPAARRASTYYYVDDVSNDVNGDGASGDTFDDRMLPMTRVVTRVNNSSATANDGFPVHYGVGAVLCRIARKEDETDPTECSTDWSQAPALNSVSLVAVAGLTNEAARATAVKAVTAYVDFSLTTRAPPLMASGTVDLTGALQIVTNPNSGGNGVPVSVWTRKNVDKGGTPNTCYADEYFRLGSGNSADSTPTLYPTGADRADQTLICDKCGCPTDASLSFSDSGASCGEGMDILDDDDGDGAAETSILCGDTQDVRADEFPCDTFLQIFGIPAWRDTNGDNFCETQRPEEDHLRPGQNIGSDMAYLRERASRIILGGYDTGFEATISQHYPEKVTTCSAIGPNASGLIWDRSGACVDNKVIGSPAGPVLLVVDGARNTAPMTSCPANANISVQSDKIFGMLFVRTSSYGPLLPTCGGDGVLRFNAATRVYGAVAVQGEVDKANGSAGVIYDERVLTNLIDELNEPTVVGLPGSWSDAVRY